MEKNYNQNTALPENTLTLVGSHDLICDVIADIMSSDYDGLSVTSSFVGSMAGLESLKRGESHMAPVHLLDEKTGEYNVSYIKGHFDEPMALIKGVERLQGLMVPAGNPQGIAGIADLAGKRYINRQKGAGTRVLFDYLLKKEGIAPASINGYDREVNTHTEVADAVKNGTADAGFGVQSAANAAGLDFVEIGVDEYDFAVPQKYLELPAVKAFIEILKSEKFKAKLEEMGGYGLGRAGEIVMM